MTNSAQKPDAVVEEIKWKFASPSSVSALGGNYFHEKMHPRHPMGMYLGRFYREWEKRGRPEREFLRWLKSLNRAAFKELALDLGFPDQTIETIMQGVFYLQSGARKSYRCSIAGGLVYWRGKLLDTREMSVGANPEKGRAIWVMSLQDVFYTASHIVGTFHHSSFLAGGYARAAGEWVVTMGKVKAMDNQTGHYRSTSEHLAYAVQFLKQQQAFFPGAKIEAFGMSESSVDQFLANVNPQTDKRQTLIGKHRK